jgi:hypothetical protein
MIHEITTTYIYLPHQRSCTKTNEPRYEIGVPVPQATFFLPLSSRDMKHQEQGFMWLKKLADLES